MSQKFEKLKSLLKELFQLNQPDLDFGLYRIMHAKAAEVTQFLEHELLPQVRDAFAEYKTADKAELEAELAKAIEQARSLGVDPETTLKVKDLRAQLKTDAVDIDQLENDVYDHLYQFFSRYYSDGDFISKRRYSKDGKYAIPYDGEEVKLYWANHDQYYIKTSEYLRDYAFRLRPDDEANPMRVHFRLVDAAEGEHGNVKPANGKDRVFVLRQGDGETGGVGVENGELVIRFEYRPATLQDWGTGGSGDGGKKKPPTQKDLTAIAEARILDLLAPSPTLPFSPSWHSELSKPHVKADGTLADYTRLRAHLNRYVARNTFDYFIHKDLGGFLRRELDFYIKNEVMMLDDIENETVPRVEQYLSKIKVIRRIAGKIITFLAQLEDFQKALWLKKKFVVETNWCVALKEIPEEFLPEIAANAGQLAEWKALYGLDGATGGRGDGESGLFSDDDAVLVSLSFPHPDSGSAQLRVPKSCMIDTRHFDADFTARLLEALGDLDDKTDGVLFHSENFQALNLMQARYRERVKCVYIDPPYNTGEDDFNYKDTYQSSSWLSFVNNRIQMGFSILSSDGLFLVSIDDHEIHKMRLLSDSVFGRASLICVFVWKRRSGAMDTVNNVSIDHDYVLAYGKSQPFIRGEDKTFERYSNPDNDPRGPWIADNLSASKPGGDTYYAVVDPSTGNEFWPPKGRFWPYSPETMKRKISEGRIIFPQKPTGSPLLKRFQNEARSHTKPVSTWINNSSEMDSDVTVTLSSSMNTEGTKIIKSLFSDKSFIHAKPVTLVESLVGQSTSESHKSLDFFAGSGTTGHAVINLNREDGGRRKFILVEMADYFDTVLVPRLKKVAFTPEWKDGQPKRLPTAEEIERGPRVLKIVRLESYEDTLNNLEVKRTPQQESLLFHPEAQGPDRLREQYLLQYLLKVETQGSPSLLNVAAFTDPTAYRLKVKRPGSDESREVCVDLIETFNWLLGLTVEHMAAPQVFTAEFERDSEKRLRLKGRLKPDAAGPYWFRTVTGTMPDSRMALVIWRKLTGNPEEDNLVLDEWFTKQGYSSKDSEFDLIYVNGDNNLENLKTPDDTWKVRLIEDDFHRLMFAGEGV